MWKFLVQRRKRRKLLAIAAVLLGLMTVFFIVEFGLRLLGWWWTLRGPLEGQNPDNADFVILCTGDSHTYGKGAPEGYDYPAQLAARLQETYPGKRFAVVNLGKAGNNSSQAVNRVLEFMKEMSQPPQLIIFNAGKNNDHNFAEARFLPQDINSLDISWQIKYLLANSRAFRLGQVSVSRLRQLLLHNDPRRTMHWDSVLDVDGEAEQELIRDWIRRDIEYLLAQTDSERLPVVLLNYWLPVETVDQVFTELSSTDRITFIDARRFGLNANILHRLGEMDRLEGLIAPDGHPNQYGYALIARLVYQRLTDHGLFPAPN